MHVQVIIQKAFDVFAELDYNDDQEIDFAELKAFLTRYHNMEITDEETRAILDMADLDSNGTLNFSEFYSIYACLTIVSEQFDVQDVKQVR